MKSIVIAGGSGLIGTALYSKLSVNYSVKTLSRNAVLVKSNPEKYIFWDPSNSTFEFNEFNGDILINLAGENIAGKRWTKVRKESIVKSRTEANGCIEKILSKGNIRLGHIINASAVGYYGDRDNEELDEKSTSGNDFLSQTCRMWEESSLRLVKYCDNHTIIRIGLVLANEGGALPKMIMTRKFGFLTYFGNGKQYYPWIHLDDIVNSIEFILENKVGGVVNLVSPSPVTNKELIQSIKPFTGAFAIFPIFSFVLQLVMGEMSSIVLSSVKAMPNVLLGKGFKFKFPTLQAALQDLSKQWK